MRLVSYRDGERVRAGRLEGESIVELEGTVAGYLEAGADALGREGGKRASSEVELLSPVPDPPRILAVGLNYADHIEETGMKTPEIPLMFNKQTTAVTGPFAPVHLPKVSDRLDYEGELGFVVGRRCRHVPKDRAHEVIAGYLVADDVSVRDWQRRSPTMTMGKSFDTHCPLGPALVTVDELGGAPSGLDLRTTVNGEVRQSSNTRHLIFDPFDLVEHLTQAFTLLPGDVVLTGTCGGVAAAMDPPAWLEVGDVVRVEIEGLGAIENEIVAEPDPQPW